MTMAEKLTQIAGNEQRVYNAGKKAEHDAFWDAFQQNGERRLYLRGFNNNSACWTNANFKPKYDIICEGDASMCFYAWEKLPEDVDLGAILKAQGITVDTSKATNMTNFMAYGYSIIGELPAISFESAGANTIGALRGVSVTKIEKLIVTEQTNFSNMFTYCNKIEEIRFEGTIANGNLDLYENRSLSAESLKSIIGALSDSATGLTVKLPKEAEANYNANPPEGAPQTWAELVATKQNWSIAYA